MKKKYIVATFVLAVAVLYLSNGVDSYMCFPEYECGEWSECNATTDIQQRVCKDIKCGTEDILERRFCSQKQDCTPDLKCGEWSECYYEKEIGDIIKREVSFEGYMERECVDLNGCIETQVERKSCSLSVPVEVKKREWCNQEYIEIFDAKTKKLVSRIKETKLPFGDMRRVDISFVTSEAPKYCSYCYDGIKNYDETGVDCGGKSCPPCIETEEFFDWLYWTVRVLWAVLIFSVLIAIFILMKASRKNNTSKEGRVPENIFRKDAEKIF